jgi:aminoglycoside phosphotransferase (APT) family kinase protein
LVTALAATGDVRIDVQRVRRLLAAQFPHWAELPLARVDAAGLDNCIYRLGADLVVRLPRRALGAAHSVRERQWLPVLARRLPLPVPVLLGGGAPAEGYPWHWTVSRWLAGRNAVVQPVADQGRAAVVLARFVTALQAIDPAGGPASEFRGGGDALAGHDRAVRAAIEVLPDTFDPAAVTAAWETALAAPRWTGPGVWIHGDLHPANLLVHQGRISAVIDFGLVAVGDSACDLMVAWTFLTASARRRFRAALAVDDATWLRARGWALEFGLMCAAHADGNPVLGRIGQHTVNEVVTDHTQAAVSAVRPGGGVHGLRLGSGW